MADQIDIAKLVPYAVTGGAATGASVSKLVPYAVTGAAGSGVSLSKAVVYAITGEEAAPTATRRPVVWWAGALFYAGAEGSPPPGGGSTWPISPAPNTLLAADQPSSGWTRASYQFNGQQGDNWSTFSDTLGVGYLRTTGPNSGIPAICRVANPAGAAPGETWLKFDHRDGDALTSSGNRTEIAYGHTSPANTFLSTGDYFVLAWCQLVPSGATSELNNLLNENALIAQMHGFSLPQEGAGPSIGIDYKGAAAQADRYRDVQIVSKPPDSSPAYTQAVTKTWIGGSAVSGGTAQKDWPDGVVETFVMEGKLGHRLDDTTAYLKVWRNGTLIADLTGPNAFDDTTKPTQGHYWKFGMYNYNPPVASGWHREVYMRRIICWKSASGPIAITEAQARTFARGPVGSDD